MKRQRLMFVSTTRATLAALMALVVFTAQTPVAAADTDLAQGADTDKVYMVLSAKFKPGKAPEALKMIREHFLKVDKAVGRRVIPFDQTGEWDHVVYFPYDPVRGDTIPSMAEWMKALAAQEGGMEQAQKLLRSWFDLMDTSRTDFARLPAAWVP
jgi:hypothetical protein